MITQIPQYVTPATVQNPYRVLVWASLQSNPHCRQKLDVVIDRLRPHRRQLEAIVREQCGDSWVILPQDWMPTGDVF